MREDEDLVGDGHLTVRLGPSTRLFIDANRGLWSSFFLDHDFYRSQGVEATFERVGRRRSSVGGIVGFQAVDYPRGVEEGPAAATAGCARLPTLRSPFASGQRCDCRSNGTAGPPTSRGSTTTGTAFFAGMVLGWF